MAMHMLGIQAVRNLARLAFWDYSMGPFLFFVCFVVVLF